jgi:hypothetical protein
MLFDPSKSHKLIGALLIAGGLASAGYFIGAGLEKFRIRENHTVHVKGISERQVKADFAIWNIRFKATGKTFQEARDNFYKSHKTLSAFLTEVGFTSAEISEAAPETQIRYHAEKTQEVSAYDFSGTFTVRTDHVDQVEKHATGLSRLAEQGVMLGQVNQQWGHSASDVRYFIRDFDAVRPQMLEEATQSARAMAEKFAEHSHTKVGTILKADQGNFSIEGLEGPYDGNVSLMKKIRLVTYVTYILKS